MSRDDIPTLLLTAAYFVFLVAISIALVLSALDSGCPQ